VGRICRRATAAVVTCRFDDALLVLLRWTELLVVDDLELVEVRALEVDRPLEDFLTAAFFDVAFDLVLAVVDVFCANPVAQTHASITAKNRPNVKKPRLSGAPSIRMHSGLYVT
jgi:hypothetical protein